MPIIPKYFYRHSAITLAPTFLGKYIVHNTPKGKLGGIITDVEAYPAFSDNVSHGNKRTKRTEIMYGEGGHAYVYLIYGIYHQFAVVVNGKDIPEVVFIRAVKPVEGIDIMKKNIGRLVKNDTDLTKSPGLFCKAFNITIDHYGADLQGDTIWIEDRGVVIKPEEIKIATRVGIKRGLEGSGEKLRFYINSL
jgi:DNA-3-methyladenine glycosylase